MRYRILGPIMAVVAALVTASVFAGAAAQAGTIAQPSAKLQAEQLVFDKVVKAADQQGAYRSLSAVQKSLFAEAMTHQAATEVVSRTGRLPDTTANRGCWYHYQYDKWSNFDYVEGDTWMQLDWCSNGPSITRYSVPLKSGKGDGGFSYDGVKSMGHLNVGWEIRQYVEFNFDIAGVHAYPCMQIRGGHTGRYSQSESCNLS